MKRCRQQAAQRQLLSEVPDSFSLVDFIRLPVCTGFEQQAIHHHLVVHQLKLSCISQLSSHVNAATRLSDMLPSSAVIKHFLDFNRFSIYYVVCLHSHKVPGSVFKRLF